jgi:hypothetical protein
VQVTTGNRVFAESNILRRELNLKLSAKTSLARVKKIFSAKKKLSAKNFFAESKKKYSRRRILHREQAGWLSAKKFFGESFYCSRRRNF